MRTQIEREERTENCERHGAFTSEHYRNDREDWWTRCPECAEEERVEYVNQRERVERNMRIRALRERACLPDRYRGKTLADSRPVCDGEKRALSVAQDFVANFADHLGAGRCLLFSGKPGTGKTRLGCAVGENLIENEKSVRYITAAQLIREIRAPWNKPDSQESVDDVLRRFQRYDLLILDEVGVGFRSDAEIVQLTELIDLRYNAMKPTLVISNYTPTELCDLLGDRAVDRLRDNYGKIVIFDWPSRRR